MYFVDQALQRADNTCLSSAEVPADIPTSSQLDDVVVVYGSQAEWLVRGIVGHVARIKFRGQGVNLAIEHPELLSTAQWFTRFDGSLGGSAAQVNRRSAHSGLTVHPSAAFG